MRKDARCIIDDDRDGHSGEISSAEEFRSQFRLVKISSAGTATWDEACATDTVSESVARHQDYDG